MDVNLLSAYLPMERRHALAASLPLPDRAVGAVLLADIAGFTPLADAVTAAFGAQRGAEELTRLLNDVYDVLIAQVHRYGGSVVSFVGDALVCWFAGDEGQRAVACGLAMQEAMDACATVEMPGGGAVSFSMKAGVASGPVRRFLVGDPQVQRLDVLAGAPLERMAQAEQLARREEVVAGPEVAQQLGGQLVVAAWREGYGVVTGLAAEVAPAPWPELDSEALAIEALRAYLLPPVYERLLAGQGEFLAELRPAVMLFLRFAGIEYEDDKAGPRLDAYVCWLQQVLRRYNGYLLQLTVGDKGSFFYAAFGALAAHEDDAERAVAAALALQQLPPELQFITRVQVGVSRGRVRVGAYGGRARRTYGAIGSEVNVACRLMEVAPVGEVRCSRRVYHATRERWQFAALPPVQIKGRAEPLAVYRPLRQKQERVLHTGGALVGRQVEVQTLGRLLAEVASGQRRVVLLEGEAGIGKSRLVGELARLTGEAGVAWLLGAGQSIEQRTPYRAWWDLLVAHFGLDEQTVLSGRQRRVQEQVVAMDPVLVERLPLLNDILRLDLPETDLTRSFDPKLRHDSLTALVIDLLRAAVSDSALVLVLEDAHWLDSLSWELALSVARALYDQPLLLVLALRPLEEPLRTEYSALAELEDVETLRLEAMPPEETVALAATRLGVTPDTLPKEVAELVRERAGGNPFFAEELAYVLRDSGVLSIEGETCTLCGDPTALRESVPDTVEGVVLSRIDRLPPEEQLTLKVAAVIGRSFLYRTLYEVHPQQVVEDLLNAYLGDLARRDLTLMETLKPELSYLFKHVITQQVAYDTLLFSQRRNLHRTVAGWYERVYTENLAPYYPLLVHHWHQAEDVEQERHYAKLAGEQAAAQFANAEAVAYFSRALKLTPEDDLAARFDLLLAREGVNSLRGERVPQVKDLTKLEALARQLTDDRDRVKLALRQGAYYTAVSDYSTAREYLGQAWEQAQAVGDREGEADGLHLLACVHFYLGDFAAAQDVGERALALARAIGNRSHEIRGLYTCGTTYHMSGNHRAAQECYEHALALSRNIGERQLEGTCLYILGRLFRDLGSLSAARECIAQSLAIARAIGDRNGEVIRMMELAGLYEAWGEFTAASDLFEQTLTLNRRLNHQRGLGYNLADLGVVSHRLGKDDVAQICCEQALGLIRSIGDRWGEAGILNYLGLALEGQGNLEAAAEAYGQALAIKHEINQQAWTMEDRAGLARIALTQDRIAEALQWINEILAWVSEHGVSGIRESFPVYLAAYRVLVVSGEDSRAREVLIKAYAELMERVDRIDDKELRRSFLENVAAHREIVAAYQAMQAASEQD